MAFENLLSAGYLLSLLVNAVVAFIAIVASNKFIAHNIESKHSFLLAIIALFATPLLTAYVFGAFSLPVFVAAGVEVVSGFLLPLLVWVLLVEALLDADRRTKLKVAVVAFVVYLLLSVFLTPVIRGALPF